MADNELFGNSEQLDTISRRETVKSIRDAMLAWSYMPLWREDKIVDAVKALPSAQKKGHWIDEKTSYSCSECHRGCWVNSNYCPWCGADMRGESDG